MFIHHSDINTHIRMCVRLHGKYSCNDFFMDVNGNHDDVVDPQLNGVDQHDEMAKMVAMMLMT